MAGLAFALLANQLSPRGLKLTRDFFPKAIKAGSPPRQSTHAPAPGSGTNSAAVPEALAARLREQGLQLLEHDRAVALYQAPEYAQERIIFVDARNDQHYPVGHIPGAFQLDHYHPENYLPAVLPACLAAQKIVVYCTGGDCEDSEFTAVMLTQAGVPLDKLLIYAGGFTEWSAHGLPVEIGARKSGTLRDPKP
jgi:rhodanese-related sulfurtransferase